MKKKKLVSLGLISIMLLTGCSSATLDHAGKEISDVVSHIKDVDNPYVLMVKNGYRVDNPDVTYDEAFTAFFGSPKWKYFEGQDGQDVVEFTGECTYADVPVKARIQFVVDKEKGTFDATYLAFNEVPQNMLYLVALIESAFSEVETSHTETNTMPATSNQVEKVVENNINEEYEAMKAEKEYYQEVAYNLSKEYDQAKSESEYYKSMAEEANRYQPVVEDYYYYILADSDSRYISKSELYGLTAEECRLARNEIYARHGRMFNDSSLQSYFNAQDWYYPSVPSGSFSDSVLNKYEVANIDTIVAYEKSLNGSSSSNNSNKIALSPYLYGEISSRGETIEGYTTDYVCNNGPKRRQWVCEDTWHVTAKNKTYSRGVTWYECWDTDDGDYYGWIDGNFLAFYNFG